MSSPAPLSVAIVCKNNAATIGRTLESVKGLATEIVGVDSGSTDGTIEILERHGARVIRSEWLGHVKTKQMALEACRAPWVLSLDSDESLDDELRGWFLDEVPQLSRDSQPYHFWMRRVTWYNGRPLRYAWQPEWRIRLVWKRAFRWGGLNPHDQLLMDPGGAPPFDLALRAEGSIRHDSIGTWSEFYGKQIEHARTMAKSMHAQGMTTSVWKLATSPVGAFLKQMVLKRAFRDGWPGWVAAASTAMGTLAKHAILLELSRAAGEESGGDESRPETVESGRQRTDA